MKARLLKKLLNDTGYIVNNNRDYIAVGSALCHDLISVDKKTLRIKYALDTFHEGRKAIRHTELEFIWDKLHELKESGELKNIIDGNDEIENTLPVFSVEEGDLIETVTDQYGYPNVTISGDLMYENTWFKTKKEAAEYGVKDCGYAIQFLEETIHRLQKELYEKIEKRNYYVSKRLELEAVANGS